MRMPDSFNMATLLPAAAMRPRRPAEPVREVRMEEKVSDCDIVTLAVVLLPAEIGWICFCHRAERGPRGARGEGGARKAERDIEKARQARSRWKRRTVLSMTS